MEHTILFGNGIYRACNTEFEWAKVLASSVENGKQSITCKLVPYPHVFEDILLNGKCPKRDEGTNLKHQIKATKESIKANLNVLLSLSKPKLNEMFKLLLDIDATNYLTTNYDSAICDVFENCYQAEIVKEDTDQDETYYSIKRRTRYRKDKTHKTFWNIHGAFCKPESIMLGYQHYCNSVQRISHYLRTGKNKDYDLNGDSSILTDFPTEWDYMQKRVSFINKNGVQPEFKTWIDTLFLTNVHIIGLGLSFDEIDLWEILNKWKIYQSDGNDHPNKIIFYGAPKIQTRLMLESYGVTIEEMKQDDKTWEDYYIDIIKRIRTKVNT